MKPCQRWIAALLVAAACVPAAQANDRPFQVARTAVFDDDDQGWSIESWAQRLGSVRGLSIEPEYTFGNGFSIQTELSRTADRRERETGHEAEVEFKQVFNDIVRDGWGWGLSAALAATRTRDTDGTQPSIGIKLPLTLPLGARGSYLHLDVGVDKARGERRAFTGAVAIEHELAQRTSVFAELAREGTTTFAQIGARHWLRREKLAVDLSLQQQRAAGTRGAGVIVGIGWYDL